MSQLQGIVQVTEDMHRDTMHQVRRSSRLAGSGAQRRVCVMQPVLDGDAAYLSDKDKFLARDESGAIIPTKRSAALNRFD